MASTLTNMETSNRLWGSINSPFNGLSKLPMKAEEELYVQHPEFRKHLEQKYLHDPYKADSLLRAPGEHLYSDHGLTVDLNINNRQHLNPLYKPAGRNPYNSVLVDQERRDHNVFLSPDRHKRDVSADATLVFDDDCNIVSSGVEQPALAKVDEYEKAMKKFHVKDDDEVIDGTEEEEDEDEDDHITHYQDDVLNAGEVDIGEGEDEDELMK